MMTLKDKLTEAINNKNNDIKTFVWKYPRKTDGSQEEIRLIDATAEQLNQFYSHCKSMLYSESKSNPGRYILLDIIREQREKCNVELYLRKLNDGSLTNGEPYPRHLYCQDIMSCIRQNKEIFPQNKLKELSISMITGSIPREFSRLSISSVIDGCLDQLGTINTTHITYNFILNMGIYLTPSELKDCNEKDAEGNRRKKPDIIKERLGLKPTARLTIKPNGLSFSEFRSMLKLTPTKYSNLTTDQLTTLRNKVLFRLEQEVNYHIDQWEDLMRKIELVAENKNIILN
jgi:hypothetical protein